MDSIPAFMRRLSDSFRRESSRRYQNREYNDNILKLGSFNVNQKGV